MRTKFSYCFLSIFFFLICLGTVALAQKKDHYYNENSKYPVDPFVGTDGIGRTSPAATLPNSVVSLGPDIAGTQPTCGYESGHPMIGFSHTRLSGTGGGGRYGNFLVTPGLGRLRLYDKFFISHESAEPGYYSCHIDSSDIDAQLTLTPHVGLHQYSFKKNDTANLVFDVSATRLTSQKSVCREAYCKIVSNYELQGYGIFEGGFGGRTTYKIHFKAVFDRPFATSGTFNEQVIHLNEKEFLIKGDSVKAGAFFRFFSSPDDKNQVKIKVAIAYRSLEKAAAYLNDAPGWNFDIAKVKAKEIWDDYLGKIQVSGGSFTQRKLFYSSFYKTAMMPRDLTGDNPLWSSIEPHFWEFYCFWDTFRTLNPLLTLVDRPKEVNIIRCLLDIYSHTGWLPDLWTAGYRGTVQGGSNADIVIAEAMVKKLKGFDYEKAYEAISKDATINPSVPYNTGRYLNDYLRYGYIPVQGLYNVSKIPCGTSRTLEYAYNDYCIGLAARVVGREQDYHKYLKRSDNVFKYLYNDSLKVFWARDTLGKWLSGFVPEYSSNHYENGKWAGWQGPYYEGSPWTYSGFALQNVSKLIGLHGGNKPFCDFLDHIFDKNLYEADNEPCMHLPWLYIYAGKPHQTFERLQYVLKQKFTDARDGWPGNDDAGTVSAWYMWAAMGIYPVSGQDIYLLTTPVFQSITMNVGEGKKFRINAVGLTEKNTYIKSATLNGKDFNRAYIRHSELIKGGTLILKMSDRDYGWGSKNVPPSFEKVLSNASKQ